MFVFKKTNTFTAAVRIYDPTEGGRKVAKEIKVDYRVLEPERVQELADRAQASRMKGDFCDDAKEILEEVVCGWSGIKEDDKGGPDFTFSDENLLALIAIPYVRSAMLEGYFEGVNGKARKGN